MNTTLIMIYIIGCLAFFIRKMLNGVYNRKFSDWSIFFKTPFWFIIIIYDIIDDIIFDYKYLKKK